MQSFIMLRQQTLKSEPCIVAVDVNRFLHCGFHVIFYAGIKSVREAIKQGLGINIELFLKVWAKKHLSMRKLAFFWELLQKILFFGKVASLKILTSSKTARARPSSP